MSYNRRFNLRVSDSRLITEIIQNRPDAAAITNISPTGMYTIKPVTSGLSGPEIIQLEIPVPEASETIWASGEVVYESLGRKCLGAGIKFLSMADFHWSLLYDLVETRRREILSAMIRKVRWQKDLAAFPSPYTAPPPPPQENTVKQYIGC